MITCLEIAICLTRKMRQRTIDDRVALIVFVPCYLTKTIVFRACKNIRDILLIFAQDIDNEAVTVGKDLKA